MPRKARSSRPRTHGRPGGREVRVKAIRRDPPDLDRFVAALLALALAERDAEDPEPQQG